MARLTAAGEPFGEAKVTAPPGTYDWVWRYIKVNLQNAPEMEKIRADWLLEGLPRNRLKDSLKIMLIEAIPVGLCDADLDRYAEELTTLITI